MEISNITCHQPDQIKSQNHCLISTPCFIYQIKINFSRHNSTEKFICFREILMKRQRSMPGNGTSNAAKRPKRKEKDEVVMVEERRDFMAVAQEILMDWEEWSCCSSSMWAVGDEQMSWGTCWYPFWDMELMGEAYNALYSDVVWEEDIWDLKAIKEIPTHEYEPQT